MMATNRVVAYGRRLFPRVLDELAKKDLNRVYAAAPKTSDVKDGYYDILVANLPRYVDFMANWLEDKFGRNDSFETITYIGASDLQNMSGIHLGTLYEAAEKFGFLTQILAVSFIPAATIKENEDFFAYGLNSVQTLGITANLKRNLKGQTPNSVAWISHRTIFRNLTLADLSKLLAAFINENIIPEDSEIDRSSDMDEAVARHVRDLPGKPLSRVEVPPAQILTVALIGSTSYLGSHLVVTLSRNPQILRIYSLNRSSNAQEKQIKSFDVLDKGLHTSLHKLTYIKVEIGKPLLGLSQDNYNLIASEVEVIVYNVWRLDFGLAI